MVLDLVLIGLAVTLFPFPLMAFVLVLSTRGGAWKGLAFIIAWLACLVAVVAAVLLLTQGKPRSRSPRPRRPPSPANSPSASGWWATPSTAGAARRAPTGRPG